MIGTANLVNGVASRATDRLTMARGVSLGTVTVSSGTATLVAPLRRSGLYEITAAYSGDGNYEAGSAAAQAIVVTRTVGLSDFDGDARSDVLWRHDPTGAVFRQLMNGLVVVDGARIYDEPTLNWRIVGEGDFDGDGRADLLWRNEVTGDVYVVYLGIGGLATGGGLVTREPNLAVRIIHTPDLDGDGRADILWWNAQTGGVWAMLMNGTTIVAQGAVHAPADTRWRIVAVGDFSGAGKVNQLLWHHQTTGEVYLYWVSHEGGGVFSETVQAAFQEPDVAWRIFGALDLDGDGRTDIVWRNETTGHVYGMLMNGATVLAGATVYAGSDAAWRLVALEDYDGDGRADLLWRNESTGVVYMMLMEGFAIRAQGTVYQEPDPAWRILGPLEWGRALELFAP